MTARQCSRCRLVSLGLPSPRGGVNASCTACLSPVCCCPVFQLSLVCYQAVIFCYQAVPVVCCPACWVLSIDCSQSVVTGLTVTVYSVPARMCSILGKHACSARQLSCRMKSLLPKIGNARWYLWGWCVVSCEGVLQPISYSFVIPILS